MAQDKWNPDQYLRFEKERARPFYDLLAMVKRKSAMRVVDLGCGPGELTLILHRELQASATVGIDNSEAMLQKAAQISASGLKFQSSNIEKYSGNDLDLVFSNAALQWCPHHENLFRNLTNTLNSTGQLAVQMPANHDYITHTTADKMSSEEPWRSLLAGYKRDSPVLTPEKYAQLLFDIGYVRQDVRLQVYNHLLSSRTEVIEWVKGTLLTAFESRLNSDEFSKFLEEYKERLFRVLPDKKPFFYPFKRLLIWGSRAAQD